MIKRKDIAYVAVLILYAILYYFRNFGEGVEIIIFNRYIAFDSRHVINLSPEEFVDNNVEIYNLLDTKKMLQAGYVQNVEQVRKKLFSLKDSSKRFEQVDNVCDIKKVIFDGNYFYMGGKNYLQVNGYNKSEIKKLEEQLCDPEMRLERGKTR